MSEDLSADTQPTLRWEDVFPWIEAAASNLLTTGGDEYAWWREQVDPSGTAVCAERLADLSDLMLERLSRWTIGQIFPNLAAETVLAVLPMTNRARNALARVGYYTAGDLQDLELADLLDLPNIGVGTADSILQALAGAATLGPALLFVSGHAGHLQEAPEPTGPAECVAEFGGAAALVIDDLRTLASWSASLGMATRPLLGTQAPFGSPHEVIEARQRLELISAFDVLVEREALLDAAALLQQLVSMLDDRTRQILVRRFFADRPETLDKIGADLGVTRERVRQIESRARANLVQALELPPLDAVSGAVRGLVSAVLPLGDLLELIPALSRMVDAAEQSAWQVLDRLDDAYEIKDGWCATPTILSAQAETITRLQEHANRHGVAVIGDLPPLNTSQSGERAVASMRDWLRYCGFAVHGDAVFTRVQSVGDRAAAILSVTGVPLSSEDLLSKLGVERSILSLKGAMASDDRFERVDRDKWALAEWGLATYSGIRSLIRDEIAREGGRISMDTLIERITAAYSVSANSVATYASAPPFAARAGIVKLASEDRDTRKNPERTRRLYRRSDSWLYRVTITSEHLRGSGSPAPVALATVLGIQHEQTRQLTSALGIQTLSWTGQQPAFGTIRRILVAKDIEIGSEVFLVIGDDGSFGIEQIDMSDAAPLERALRLAGVTDSAAHLHARTALASAILLPEESPVASVIGGYRDRGDTDIAELLLLARDALDDPPADAKVASSADIDEIMELL